MNKSLHEVVCRGDLRAASRLLQSGEDVESIGPHRWSLLTLAAVESTPEMIRLLLACGADLHRKDAPDRRGRGDGKTALHWAALYGKAEAVRVLLEAGAEVNKPDDFGGSTPLHLAAAKAGNIATVQGLAEYGANLNALDRRGGSPLFHACFPGDPALADWLLQAGAEVNLRDHEGKTALILLAKLGFGFRSQAAADRLLEGGIERNARDNT